MNGIPETQNSKPENSAGARIADDGRCGCTHTCQNCICKQTRKEKNNCCEA